MTACAGKQSSAEEAETAETTAIQAEQEIESARAELASLKATEKQLVAQHEDINLNKAQIVSDEVVLELQKQYLSETKVVSPIDGIVSARDIQVGQIISSGISNVGGGDDDSGTILDLSRVFILASVDESQIGSVALGQATEITADAFPGVKFAGAVVRIATKGVDVSNVITFEVKVEVTSENKSMLNPP